jgi:hypothetical protein
MGRNEQLALVGAAISVGSYLVGLLLDDWGFGLAEILLVVGAVVAAGVVLMGASALSAATRAAALRIGAGVVAAYAFIDLGNLISELDDWGALTMVLVIATAIGAALLLVAAWRLTGGDIVADATGLVSASGRSMPNRLAILGGSAILVGWFFLRAGNVGLSDTSILAVLATVLALATAWLAAGGAGAIQWPLPASYVLAGLAAIVALLGLVFLLEALRAIGGADPLDLIGLILYVGGAAALVAGAVLGLQAQRIPPPA